MGVVVWLRGVPLLDLPERPHLPQQTPPEALLKNSPYFSSGLAALPLGTPAYVGASPESFLNNWRVRASTLADAGDVTTALRPAKPSPQAVLPGLDILFAPVARAVRPAVAGSRRSGAASTFAWARAWSPVMADAPPTLRPPGSPVAVPAASLRASNTLSVQARPSGSDAGAGEGCSGSMAAAACMAARRPPAVPAAPTTPSPSNTDVYTMGSADADWSSWTRPLPTTAAPTAALVASIPFAGRRVAAAPAEGASPFELDRVAARVRVRATLASAGSSSRSSDAHGGTASFSGCRRRGFTLRGNTEGDSRVRHRAPRRFRARPAPVAVRAVRGAARVDMPACMTAPCDDAAGARRRAVPARS